MANKLLVPIDFSSYSRHALDVADAWAQADGDATLELMHVHPVVDVAVLDFAWVQPAERLAELCSALEGQLADWARTLKTPAERVSQEVVLGTPVEEIVKRCEDADVAILGTHGRSGMGHFLIGSVAERVVRLARCSVFIAKAKKDLPA